MSLAGTSVSRHGRSDTTASRSAGTGNESSATPRPCGTTHPAPRISKGRRRPVEILALVRPSPGASQHQGFSWIIAGRRPPPAVVRAVPGRPGHPQTLGAHNRSALTAYSPEPDSPSRDGLALLASWAATVDQSDQQETAHPGDRRDP